MKIMFEAACVEEVKQRLSAAEARPTAAVGQDEPGADAGALLGRVWRWRRVKSVRRVR